MAILLLAFNLRTAVTSLPPVLRQAQDDLGMSVAGAAVVGMAPTAAFAVLAAVTPAVVRRLGLERTAWVAMAVTGAGHLLRAAAPGSATFITATVLALAGMGIGNVVAPPLVKRWFGDRIGMVTGLYVLLVSLGSALPAQLAVPLEGVGGWRLAVGCWAVLAVAAALPWVVVERRRHSPAESAESVPPGPVDEVPRTITWARTARSPVAWGLAVLFGSTSLSTYALLTWLPTMLTEDAGVDSAAAGTMLAVYAGLGMPLSLLVPPIAARMRNPSPIVVVAALCLVGGYAGMSSSPQSGTWGWIVLLGMGGGTFPLALALINLRSVTPGGATALSGFCQAVGYTLACAGPLVSGLMHERTGGWASTWIFLGAVLVALTVGGLVACRPVTIEQSLARR